MSNDIVPYKEPPRLTEREVRIAGQVSNRLCNLRGAIRQGVKGGSITVQTRNGVLSQSLPIIEIEALVALLIERDEAFLIGLNIEIDKYEPH